MSEEREKLDQDSSSITPMRRRSDPDSTKKQGDTEKKRPLYRRPRFMLIAGILLLLGLIFGLRYYLFWRSHESTDDAFISGNVVQVSPKVSGHVLRVYVTDNQFVKVGDLLVEIDPRDFEMRLEQARANLLSAQDRYKEAQANLNLTKVSTRANLEQASSGVTRARAGVTASESQAAADLSRVNEARQQVSTNEATAEREHALVAAAEAAAIRDRKDVERYRRLVMKDEISRQRFDQAVATANASEAELRAAEKRAAAADAQVKQAQAALKTAEENYNQALSQITAAKAQVGEALGKLKDVGAVPQRVSVSSSQEQTRSSEIKEAEAAVKQAELDLSYTKIYASETGRVTKKSVDPGEVVQIGQSLMALAYGDIWVTANFKETQLTQMKVGQPVEVKVDAYPDRKFKGYIDSFQSGTGASFSLLPPENATGNYVKVVQRVPVKIVFDKQPDQTINIAIGMSVEPIVNIKAAPDTKEAGNGGRRTADGNK